jgi:hypothetical protein
MDAHWAQTHRPVDQKKRRRNATAADIKGCISFRAPLGGRKLKTIIVSLWLSLSLSGLCLAVNDLEPGLRLAPHHLAGWQTRLFIKFIWHSQLHFLFLP